MGKKLARVAKQRDVLEANGVGVRGNGPGVDEAVTGPFRYMHLGSLA